MEEKMKELSIFEQGLPNVTNYQLTAGEVQFDNKKYLEQIEVIVKNYEGVIIAEESIQDFKKEVAVLRKFKKQIDDFRKAEKKKYELPFKKLETGVKELTSKLDEAISIIDSQLSVFEEKRKNEKMEEIKKIAAQIKQEYSLPDDFQFEEEESFLNITAKLKDIKLNFEQQAQKKIEDDQLKNQIKTMIKNYLELFQDKYNLKKKIKLEEVEGLSTLPINEISLKIEEIYISRKQIEEEESTKPRKTLKLKFNLTLEEAKNLYEFLQNNGIEFEKID